MSSDEKRIVLVTGFGPFKGFPVNASWESVKLLDKYENEKFRIVAREIPVEYKHVDEEIPKLWKELAPTLVIHAGVSQFAEHLTLEHIANRSGYVQPDAAGQFNETGECCRVSKDLLTTELNVHKISETINTIDSCIKTCVSTNAGRYLCEYIYFKSLSIDQSRTMFIHVPPLDKPYSSKQIADGILHIINTIFQIIESE